MRTARPLLVLALTGLAGLTACGGATPVVRRSEAERLDPRVLYPMLASSQWVYDVHTGPEPPTLGIFEVVLANGDRRGIATNLGMAEGGRVRRGETVEYEIAEEGIRHVASDRWVLRAPIREGASWPAMGGRTARVTNLDTSVEVEAGRYEHCVEVTEDGGEDGRTVRTIYCPDVGPVVMESRIETRLTMRSVETVARLRSYTASADEE